MNLGRKILQFYECFGSLAVILHGLVATPASCFHWINTKWQTGTFSDWLASILEHLAAKEPDNSPRS